MLGADRIQWKFTNRQLDYLKRRDGGIKHNKTCVFEGEMYWDHQYEQMFSPSSSIQGRLLYVIIGRSVYAVRFEDNYLSDLEVVETRITPCVCGLFPCEEVQPPAADLLLVAIRDKSVSAKSVLSALPVIHEFHSNFEDLDLPETPTEFEIQNRLIDNFFVHLL